MLLNELAADVRESLTSKQKVQIAAINDWDLEDIRIRVQERLHWPDDLVDEAIAEYRKFIALVTLNPEKDYGISDVVDEIWHQHILSTRDYAAMCAATAGQMIHHEQPTARGAIRPEFSNAGLVTLRDLTRTFRNTPSKLWARDMHSSDKCKSIKLRAA
jgi:hypothetical protein